jgi:hypothetical protein
MRNNIGICGIVLVFLVFNGCVTNKGQFKAQGTTEGICLYFNYIPDGTTRLFVSMFDETTNDEIQTFADISGNELEKIKSAKELICPFVKNGHEYTISVYYYAGNESSDVEYSITSAGGIYLTNNPLLYLDTENKSVTLSAKPEFSEEIMYNSFWYQISVKMNGGQSYSYSENSNELTWNFSPMKERLVEEYGLKGDLTAFVSSYCKIKYGNILWTVGVANSDEFIVSF